MAELNVSQRSFVFSSALRPTDLRLQIEVRLGSLSMHILLYRVYIKREIRKYP